jgi:phosphate starvation-inducible protein PhoH and related proteins
MMTYKQKESGSMNIRIDDLGTIDPITERQKEAFAAWREGDNMALVGTAGTGKTFLALYLALEEVMDKSTPYDSVRIIRSVVPTRDVGYLPGTIEEKLNAYTGPYRAITSELFKDEKAYEKLLHNKYIAFESTSYIRGLTYDNTIVIVDEMQNLNFHELDSVITRIGHCSKIIFCGDYYQSDFKSENDKKGINTFLNIVEQLKHFTIVNFNWEDIVRSGLVRDYIMTKEWMEIK